ncbi:MAG: GatB/YqeY domain-containing protein [Deltaproteobacteria bacterium]|nr:GatB/YqeY domain-containing protein [Deltaproteobacteria bacterium]
MSSLGEQIDAGFKEALKSRDGVRLSILRLLRTSLKNREVEQRGPLEESEIRTVIRGLIRQGQEAVEQFEKGGRPELAEKEKAEMEILKGFLPPAASETEIRALVDQVIQEVRAVGPQDLGRVMKPVLARLAGRAEGQQVRTIVQEQLTS